MIRQEVDSETIWLLGGVQVGSCVSEVQGSLCGQFEWLSWAW